MNEILVPRSSEVIAEERAAKISLIIGDTLMQRLRVLTEAKEELETTTDPHRGEKLLGLRGILLARVIHANQLHKASLQREAELRRFELEFGNREPGEEFPIEIRIFRAK